MGKLCHFSEQEPKSEVFMSFVVETLTTNKVQKTRSKTNKKNYSAAILSGPSAHFVTSFSFKCLSKVLNHNFLSTFEPTLMISVGCESVLCDVRKHKKTQVLK